MSDEKFIEKLNEEHKARAIKLDATEFKLANDYFTAQEMEKFKKPKKMRKVLRSKTKTVKADDLLPLEPSETAAAPKPRSAAKTALTESSEANEVKKVSLKGIDFGLDKKESGEEDEDDEDEGEVKSEPREVDEDEEEDDDDIDTNKLNSKEDEEELRRILDEENDELHAVLNKTRKRVIAPLALDIKTEEEEVEENGVDFDK